MTLVNRKKETLPRSEIPNRPSKTIKWNLVHLRYLLIVKPHNRYVFFSDVKIPSVVRVIIRNCHKSNTYWKADWKLKWRKNQWKPAKDADWLFPLRRAESLDELERLVVELFKDVANKNVPAPEWNEHPFGAEQLRVRGCVVPIKDIRKLNITFPIPDLRNDYKSKPERYVSHLLGHEVGSSRSTSSMLTVFLSKSQSDSVALSGSYWVYITKNTTTSLTQNRICT